MYMRPERKAKSTLTDGSLRTVARCAALTSALEFTARSTHAACNVVSTRRPRTYPHAAACEATATSHTSDGSTSCVPRLTTTNLGVPVCRADCATSIRSLVGSMGDTATSGRKRTIVSNF